MEQELIRKEVVQESNKIITTHLGFAMVAGAIPIPFVDIAAVTAIQLDMLRQMAKHFGVDYNQEKGKSLVSALIGSTIGSTIGRVGASAVKLIPGVGTILGISTQVLFSGASTYAIGKIFESHFIEKGDFEDFEINSSNKKSFNKFFEIGKKLVKKKEKNKTDDDILETIKNLKNLHEQDILSDEEYTKAKEQLLDQLQK